MRRRSGFSLVELLVGAAIVLILSAGLLAIAGPALAGARARAAAMDMQQRLRAAAEAMVADIAAAGSGPANGVFGRPLGAVAACILPLRVGPRGDPAGSVRSDAITVVSACEQAVATVLANDWTPGGAATIVLAPGCPQGDASCGFRADTTVMLVDGRGQADLFRVSEVVAAALTLAPLGATSGRPFPAGAAVIPVTVSSYYFKDGGPAEGGLLMASDGNLSDLPLADHLTRFSIELFAEPRAPVLLGAASPRAASYGPSPPLPGEDDPRDSWTAGENCTFLDAPAGQVSRLPPLSTVTGLVALPASMTSDGPWCPDGAAAGRVDADLFRVRAVRVAFRLEASARSARGADTRLFVNPGTSRDRSAPAADLEVVFDVVPRALQRGR